MGELDQMEKQNQQLRIVTTDVLALARELRSEPHSRIDDWLAHLPAEGIRQMCAWERFCVFAREPEQRLVGIHCRLTVAR